MASHAAWMCRVCAVEMFMQRETEASLRLVGMLSEGILDRDRWRAGLDELRRIGNADHVTLVTHDRQRGHMLIESLTETLSAAAVNEYHRDFHWQDPGRMILDNPWPGRTYVDQRDAGRRSIAHMPFYQEFMRRQGLASNMGCIIASDEQLTSAVSFQRDIGRELFHPDDMAPMHGLLPSLGVIIKVRGHMQDLQARASVGHLALDAMSFPVLVLGASGEVLLTNRRGDTWQQGVRGLFQARVAHHPLRVELLRICRQAAGLEGPARCSAFRLPPQAGARAGDCLVAMPLPADHGLAWPWQRPLILVMVREAGKASPPPERVLRELFGLTPAEARLACVFAAEGDLRRVADQLCLSVETVRTQLKAVFSKTGTGRQSELLRLLAQLAVMTSG